MASKTVRILERDDRSRATGNTARRLEYMAALIDEKGLSNSDELFHLVAQLRTVRLTKDLQLELADRLELIAHRYKSLHWELEARIAAAAAGDKIDFDYEL